MLALFYLVWAKSLTASCYLLIFNLLLFFDVGYRISALLGSGCSMSEERALLAKSSHRI